MKNYQKLTYSALFSAMLACTATAAVAEESAGLEIGGVVEVEANYGKGYDDESVSDINVATVELGLEHEISSELTANVILLFEENDTPIEVDVATLTFSPYETPFSFAAGQDYLPFGSFETVLVSDPLTLEIGETRETVFMGNFLNGPFTTTFYAFNGDQDRGNEDTVANYGLRIGAVTEMVSVAVDYISNIADSDALQESDFGYATGADRVAGMSVSGLYSTDTFQISAEHLTALDPLLGDGGNSEPSASHIEVGFKTNVLNYGLAFQSTDEALFLELPKTRISAGISKDFYHGMSLGLELSHDKDYDIADGGSEETAQNIVLQLAAEI